MSLSVTFTAKALILTIVNVLIFVFCLSSNTVALLGSARFMRSGRKMKHANAARMTQVGQLDAEVPALPDRLVPDLFVITTRTDNRTRQ